MAETTTLATALPHVLPACPHARIALFAIRRMGAHGLADARAAHTLFTVFGQDFRRPLILMRTLMADLASHASGQIAIAPCCCARMTVAEAALMTILAQMEMAPGKAHFLMSDLLGVRRVDGVLASAAAVSAAFADEGRPISF
ncbi:hypothetical protein SUS17_348 [Sphingomonas sp. S17]|uniref:Uncharacterized protein n=2 Tax=Sphingomonas paucimobilis TaxID=13689 RepID=A0A411LFN5_SPHPI|nr:MULTISPECIES: DUF6628 family protein [Sphingomonas]EGI56772.1 hypothetical protein SUS17_348 [Sphingomonas sp. S17]MBQ1479967.1 hypothetical protein [Sphingomonas sp.]MCM3679132.1 hypothetical protein [Sphingomonas paucimobilis]MDG5971885.1 hypothetical protein [Sphingomonas paucimobilis]NNG58106.1 hypothetical protein [Sphingomonas paucimobilis]